MGIIIKPLVTEKMTAITDKLNRFGFVVRPEANKLEIKKEIEALYNVTVVDVNTVKYAGKNKSRYTKAGIINGRTNAFKKAIVTLKEGDTIDFSQTAAGRCCFCMPPSNFLHRRGPCPSEDFGRCRWQRCSRTDIGLAGPGPSGA